jgi:hypothetical protein
MNLIMGIKSIVFLLSLFFSGMFIDDFVENIILFSKGLRILNLFPVGLFISTIVLWSIFYYLTLI